MLFNSYEFIFLFLPITLAIFYLVGKFSYKRSPIIWLIAASFFFYSWWNPPYLFLLLLSIGVNYIFGSGLTKAYLSENQRGGSLLLTIGVIFNVGLLGYYKYSNFFIDTLNSSLNTSFFISQIILPLGISFYTFQQIGYLIDSMEGETKGYRFIDYCLFVSFFPQLIAGPIVNHQEMLPQFAKRSNFRFNQEAFSIGLTIFFMGLFKKVVLADQIALYSTPVFEAARSGTSLTVFDAWGGALAYNLQIYFDFSGYSDMAIGAARMFDIKLPLNFNSPFKAINIIDFWGRWHMTLTRFLTRYLYNPISLFMSRRRINKGKSLIKRGKASPGAFLEIVATPTIITMFISGFWHGAGWQYIVFGLLHGSYLTINHGWNMLQKWLGYDPKKTNWWGERLGQLITFLGVIVAHVFFRADSVNTAKSVLRGMLGMQGRSLGETLQVILSRTGEIAIYPSDVFGNPIIGSILIIVLMAIALFLPNTQQWMANYEPALGYQTSKKVKHQPQWLINFWQNFTWNPTPSWAFFTSVIMLAGILSLSNISEFIYFQF